MLSSRKTHAVALGGGPPSNSSGKPTGNAGDRRGVYLGALTLQLANPKALLFFLALLPQFIDPAASVVPQMLILAATSMMPEFLSWWATAGWRIAQRTRRPNLASPAI